ncbi:peptidylprolyl isomerase [Streptacidiphilus sp. P02-A3a]|uniref:peptidylprolyl isomerase n=1 Tax=Streptacidiphilus sp. P02-A3a TaxID=2704468 RepID=UPI0015F9EF96|nr:peptidylprolyl isomerase [Streptacidiphilus sp. P02-A3a]QMU73791.1 peptidylprolyl isomerase [Streptacidiphilus sp. P02-A3a]
MRVRAEKVRRARRNALIIGSSVLAVVVIAGGIWWGTDSGSKKKAVSADKATPAASSAPSAAPSATATAAVPKNNGKQWKTAPAMTIDTSAKYNITIKTNRGTVSLQLNPSVAPVTVNSFVFLTDQDYFNNVTCHRLTTSGIYVLQCGDPTGSGSGGPGYSFKDENLKAFGSGSTVTYPAGTVAMANSGANTNGSQFFLVYKDSTLPPSYTPFGTITGGMSVLNSIAAAGSDNSNGTGDGHPKESVIMQTVTAAKV